MVSEEGRKWLNDMDAASIKRREEREAAEREHKRILAEEELKKREYKEALPNVLKELREEGLPKAIPYVRSTGTGTMPENVRELAQRLIEGAETTINTVNLLKTGVDDFETIARGCADEMRSTTLDEAAGEFAATNSSLEGAIDHLNSAKEKLEEYLQALSS